MTRIVYDVLQRAAQTGSVAQRNGCSLRHGSFANRNEDMESEAVKTSPPASEQCAETESADTENANAAGEPAVTESPDQRLRGARVRTDCLNCGADRVGAFCQNCGQKYLDEPLTYWALGKAFVDRVLDLDQGVLYTFRRLAVDPGEVSLEYIKGRQRPYANPLACMVIATAIFLGLFGLTEDIVRQVTRELLTPMGGETDAMYEMVVEQVLKPYAAIIFILSCLPIAYVLRKLFSRTANYTTAETLIMVLFCTAQATLYTGICQLVVLLIPNATGVMLAQLSTVLVFPVIGHGAYGFYRRTAGDALLGFVGSLVGYFVTFALIFATAMAIGLLVAMTGVLG